MTDRQVWYFSRAFLRKLVACNWFVYYFAYVYVVVVLSVLLSLHASFVCIPQTSTSTISTLGGLYCGEPKRHTD